MGIGIRPCPVDSFLLNLCKPPSMLPIPRLQDQPYLCHSGSQAGISCSFELQNPIRTKILPYSHLLCIDLLGDRLITLRYSFADVEISIGRDFCGRTQFVDDLANFRVSAIRESRNLKIRVVTEQYSEKTEVY
jgi:hypothetical protein